MRLGLLLRELRGERAAEAAAAAVRVVPNTIYRYEGTDPATNLEPSGARLQRLLAFYGATPEQRLLAFELLDKEKERKAALRAETAA
jgi:hypothetical protein